MMLQRIRFGLGARGALGLLLAIGCSGRFANDATDGDGATDVGGSAFGGHGGTRSPGSAGSAASGETSAAGASTGGAAGAGESGMGGGAGAGADDSGAGGDGGSSAGCLGHDFNLQATLISGKVTVSGDAISDPASQGVGSLVLVHGSDTAVLGDTSSGSYSALVLPGTYDLYYVHAADGNAVPINEFVRLSSGIIVGAVPVTLDIDVPAIRITGALTANGAAITDVATTGPGAVSFVSADSRSTLLATTASGSYSALVVPGSYDLTYSYPDGTPTPSATGTRFRSGFEVGSRSLDIDIPLTPVSVAVTMNGLPLTEASSAGTLVLEDAKGGTARFGTSSPTNAYAGRVVPGTYDLYWCAPTNGHFDDTVPRNGAAKVKTGIIVGNSPLSFSVDIPVTTVSGAITINGVPAQTLGANLGEITLQGSSGSNPYFPVAAGAYSMRLVSGTYHAYFSYSLTNGNSPSNAYTQLEAEIVLGSAPLSFDLDIPATRVSGNVTIDGNAIGERSHADFSLALRPARGSDAKLLEFPTKSAYSALVIPGTYDLYYANSLPAYLYVPGNVNTRLRSGIVVGSAPLSLDIDIHGSLLACNVTANGVPLTDTGNNGSSLLLSGADPVEEILRIHGSSYSDLVLPGRYDVYYGGYGQGPTVPRNSNAYLGCINVP